VLENAGEAIESATAALARRGPVKPGRAAAQNVRASISLFNSLSSADFFFCRSAFRSRSRASCCR